MKKIRLVLAPVFLAGLVALAAGCGGGGGGTQSVPADAVAVVGSQTITKTQFNELLSSAEGQDKARGTAFPKVGTTEYTQLRDQAIAYLVQADELTQEGQKLGVTVTDKDIDARLTQLAKQYYKSSTKKLDDAIRKSGLTIAAARQQLAVQLLAQKVHDKVTSSVHVSTSEASAYYAANKASYQVAESRSVAHILVGSKSLALKLEQKIKNGANFGALAKKYSKDTGSAAQGGKLTAIKGQLVKPFQDAAFALKTGQISAPVHSQYGWHIIKALGPIKPAHLTPFSKAESEIKQNLISQKQTTAWQNFLTKMSNDFKDKVAYQTGYAPPATTATTSTATTTTTG